LFSLESFAARGFWFMKREILAAALIALVSLTAGVFLYARQNFAIFLGKAQISQIVDQAQPAETNNNGILAEPSESLADADISYRESGRQTADKIGHDLTKLEENAEPLPKAQTIIEETAKETKGAKAKKTKGAGFETKWCEFTDYYAQGKIILNEVAWMGTAANYADEWIELKNAAGREIDLDGWQLRNKSGSIGIVFPEKSAMSAGGLFLLERSDDDSVAGVKADLIYTGSLANSKEELFLFDANCELQDRVVAAPGWPGGSNKTKQTLERAANSLWQTSEYPGGTPKKENSAGDTTIVADSEAVLTSDAGGSDTSYSPRIFISEIMYNPEGSDEGREWVEIYNDGSDPANLAGWKFTTGRTDHSLSLIQGSFSLPANGYALIANATSSTAIDVGFSGNFYRASFSLRNGTSGIEPIFLKDGTAIIDQAGYESSWGANGNDKSLQRKTFGLSGLDPQNWQAEIPSPGSKNVFAGSDPDQLASNIDSGKTTATSTEEILAPPAGDAAAAPDIIDYPPSDNATTTAAASFSAISATSTPSTRTSGTSRISR